MELVGLSNFPLVQRPSGTKHSELLCTAVYPSETKRERLHASGIRGSDGAAAASVREDAPWANRSTQAWAKQSISFAVCPIEALAMDRTALPG